MIIEQHIHAAKKALDFTREHVAVEDYDIALAMLCNVMTETRDLISHVWDLKCSAARAQRPAGKEKS